MFEIIATNYAARGGAGQLIAFLIVFVLFIVLPAILERLVKKQQRASSDKPEQPPQQKTVYKAGAGDVRDPVTAAPEDSFVPSYGAGIRFMVLPSQRLNVRLDYGRSSDGQDAWYLSVAEAF